MIRREEKRMERKENLQVEELTKGKRKSENNFAFCVSMGLLSGCVGMSIFSMNGQSDFANLSIPFGVLIGTVVGLLYKKK